MSQEQEESIRYELLIKVIDKALKKSIECLSLENLRSCYPKFDNKPGIKYLNNSISQINEFFTTSTMKEINALLEEKNVKEKLAQLDSIINEAQDSMKQSAEPIFIEKLTPNYLVEYNAYLAKQKYEQKLQSLLQRLKDENGDLIRSIKESNAENIENDRNIDAALNKIQLLSKSLDADKNDAENSFEKYDDFFNKLVQKEVL